MGKKQPKLSLVVTSYTAERLGDILDLFRSVRAQTYEDLEIVAVTERSRELYRAIRDYVESNRLVNFRRVFNGGNPGLSPSRNLGIEHTSGDIVAFVDDDVVLFPDWAERMVEAYSESDSVIGVTGAALPLWQDDSLKWLPEELYWLVSCTAWTGCQERRVVRNALGTNMSFRREAFSACLFTDAFGRTPGAHKAGKLGPVGDDTEFSINVTRKTGKSIVYCPDVRVWHRVDTYRLTPRFVRRQAYWQGYTKAMIKRLYSEDVGSGLLAPEHTLLRRILLSLLPRTMGQLASQPALARRRLALTSTILFHVGLGYLSGLWPVVAKVTARGFSS